MERISRVRPTLDGLLYIFLRQRTLSESPRSVNSKAQKLMSMQELITAGADVDSKREDGWTPLHLTAYQNAINVAKVKISIE